jgi:crotonobetainyl-CoA:carnitine CoA-transferase CaiB-like acyl-CoA transferase
MFARARVPAGPINSIAEVTADKTLQDRGLFYTLEQDARRVSQVGLGIQNDEKSIQPRTLPPVLGPKTRKILDWLLYYSASKIDTLQATKNNLK